MASRSASQTSTSRNWPEHLRGLPAQLPRAGCTVDELAGQLIVAPLWRAAQGYDRPQLESLCKALRRSGPVWLALALVMLERRHTDAWRKRPAAPLKTIAGNPNARDAIVEALDALVAREWFECVAGKYRVRSELQQIFEAYP